MVDGWDDDSLKNVRGVMRSGMKVEGLKKFIIDKG
jgi:glutamyl/glutaminyl-tRNA synthetase